LKCHQAVDFLVLSVMKNLRNQEIEQPITLLIMLLH
jgi:hypothetical protein